MARRRRGWRGGRFDGSRVDRASARHAPAQRNAIHLARRATSARVRRRGQPDLLLGRSRAGVRIADLEHGIYLDDEDHVWLGGGGEKDAQLLKFTRQGKFLMQIGRKGRSGGSNDVENLGGAANVTVDRAANEVYVADGYVNHRVIVFDATTGAYKRHWGAYGKRPDDGYFERAGERLPGPFSGAVQHENAPQQL